MPIRADKKYNGTVGSGGALVETQRGTMGYQIPLTCEDGETSFTIWFTDKNRENALKQFAALGINEEQLNDPNFLEHELAQQIDGVEVSFGTKEEVYNSKRSVKVVWIGKKSEALEAGLAQAAASFFANKTPSASSRRGQGNGQSDQLEDDDIPF